MSEKIEVIGKLDYKGWHEKAKEVLGVYGICNCVHTQSNNLLQKLLIIYESDISNTENGRG